MDGQGTTWHRNIAENFNRLSRVHERYRRQTDGRTMTYRPSEHELEFTFAKNDDKQVQIANVNEYSQLTIRVIYLVNDLSGER